MVSKYSPRHAGKTSRLSPADAVYNLKVLRTRLQDNQAKIDKETGFLKTETDFGSDFDVIGHQSDQRLNRLYQARHFIKHHIRMQEQLLNHPDNHLDDTDG